MADLCEKLAALAEPYGAWVRLHYVYPYPHVDEILPLMAGGRVLPYLDVPFQHAHPDVLQAHEAAGQRRAQPRAAAALARRPARSSSCARPSSPASPARPKPSSSTCSTSCARRGSTAPAASPIRRSRAPRANELPGALPAEVREERRARFMAVAEAVSADEAARSASARRCRCWSTRAPALGRKGGVGRSYADAPEIDGMRARCCRPRRRRRTLKVGEFTRARIVGTQGPRPGRRAALTASTRRRRMTDDRGRSHAVEHALIHHPYQPPAGFGAVPPACTRRRR